MSQSSENKVGDKAAESDWGEVIFSYTDEQAQEDGVLVSLTPEDRVTGSVFGVLTEGRGAREAGVLCLSWLARYGNEAAHVYAENTGGGIWRAHLREGDLTPIEGADAPDVSDVPDESKGPVVWIMPNERGGLTIMFPEDY